MILASVRVSDKEIPVEVLSVFEGGSGRILAVVKAITGEPFTEWTHGGPVYKETTQVPVGLIHDPHFVPTSDEQKPNLLQLALAHAKDRWPMSETIWLVSRRVFLKNDGDHVSLNIVGFGKYLDIFWYDPSSGWKVCRDLEAKYQAWVSAYKQQFAHRRTDKPSNKD